MKVLTALMMVTPAVTFACLMLSVRRFNSVYKYVFTMMVSMLAAIAIMIAGIYINITL